MVLFPVMFIYNRILQSKNQMIITLFKKSFDAFHF